MKKLMVLILFSSTAFADSWFCSQEASKREANVLWMCGIGEGLAEGEARIAALNNALKQFEIVCSSSDDCAGRPKSIDPERTECKRDPKGYVSCTRLIIVTLGR